MKMNEKKLIQSIENNEWKPVNNLSDWKKKLQKAAKATIIQDARMNVKISKKDIHLLKVKALEEGISYQALVSSIIHKYVSGQLVDR